MEIIYQKANKYQEVINKMTIEGKMNYRYLLVKFAYKNGIKPAANEFNTTPNVVRKWVKRYQEERLKGLMDKTKKPHYSPNKCSAKFEQKVIDLRLQTRHKFGAKRLIDRFNLKRGKGCVQRIINQNGLKKKRKTKTQLSD